MSRRLRIALSALCAIVAVVACAVYVGGVRDEARRAEAETMRRYGGETVTLLVSTRPIESGEVLGPSDVERREWVSSLVPDGALMADEDVVGREVGVPVAANAPLCELNFRDDEHMAEVPSGHVAVSVPVTDKLGMASGVSTGSRVVPYRVSKGTAEPIGSVAVVLATPSGTGMSAGAVTIAVVSKDVPAVLSASTEGELRVVVPASDVRKFPRSMTDDNDVAPVADAATDGQDKPVHEGDGKAADAGDDATLDVAPAVELGERE